MFTEADLCASDATRIRAWAALKAWMTRRFAQRRGFHLPNLLRVSWQVVDASSGLPKREPQAVFAESFCEHFRVRPMSVAHPAALMERPLPGDEMNYYQLAIAHSDGLSKDQCFVAVRGLLSSLAHAASEGREVCVSFGLAGTFVAVERLVTFSFDCGASGVVTRGSKGGRGRSRSLSRPVCDYGAVEDATGEYNLAVVGHRGSQAGCDADEVDQTGVGTPKHSAQLVELRAQLKEEEAVARELEIALAASQALPQTPTQHSDGEPLKASASPAPSPAKAPRPSQDWHSDGAGRGARGLRSNAASVGATTAVPHPRVVSTSSAALTPPRGGEQSVQMWVENSRAAVQAPPPLSRSATFTRDAAEKAWSAHASPTRPQAPDGRIKAVGRAVGSFAPGSLLTAAQVGRTRWADAALRAQFL